ncbi:hypothetical protein EPN87_01860 [archaeon]|nr:MAG: hypothetical protein EPN87_01860 [archaeon]
MKVIGITGTIGAGKKVLKDMLKTKMDFFDIVLSDVIHAEVERKKGKADRKTLQDMGNDMRRMYGTHILAKLAVEYLSKKKNMIVIDGIRNPGEVDYLRQRFGSDFRLIAIDADPKTRFERILKRKQTKDPKTWEEFVAMDERDQGKDEPPYGQHVRACIEKADFKIVNDSSESELQKQADQIIAQL